MCSIVYCSAKDGLIERLAYHLIIYFVSDQTNYSVCWAQVYIGIHVYGSELDPIKHWGTPISTNRSVRERSEMCSLFEGTITLKLPIPMRAAVIAGQLPPTLHTDNIHHLPHAFPGPLNAVNWKTAGYLAVIGRAPSLKTIRGSGRGRKTTQPTSSYVKLITMHCLISVSTLFHWLITGSIAPELISPLIALSRIIIPEHSLCLAHRLNFFPRDEKHLE